MKRTMKKKKNGISQINYNQILCVELLLRLRLYACVYSCCICILCVCTMNVYTAGNVTESMCIVFRQFVCVSFFFFVCAYFFMCCPAECSFFIQHFLSGWIVFFYHSMRSTPLQRVQLAMSMHLCCLVRMCVLSVLVTYNVYRTGWQRRRDIHILMCFHVDSIGNRVKQYIILHTTHIVQISLIFLNLKYGIMLYRIGIWLCVGSTHAHAARNIPHTHDE